MSSKASSPTASLLRSSKLFSLPPPLRKPSPILAVNGVRDSDSATLPYPTHAAIATPPSSLYRGDWGLKRPLPKRSTAKTSTPVIRVEKVDSREHITEFQSAANHVLTLRKWQELNLPISIMGSERMTPIRSRSSNRTDRSVFESHLDQTAIDELTGSSNVQRWRFQGPWIAGKSQGEFQRYVQREIRQRKPEFLEYVRRHYAASQAATRRRRAREAGKLSQESIDTDAHKSVSDEEVHEYLKTLRGDMVTLSALIHSFLDLPASPTSRGDIGFGSDFRLPDPSFSSSIYAETGPPKTHPSAGLSYLRTNAYVDNHPILGPQMYHAPVEARIIKPRKAASGGGHRALLGVAGVVAEDDVQATFRGYNKHEPLSMRVVDPDQEGGGKIWVHPSRACIDAQGKIKLTIARVRDPIAVQIQKGELEKEEVPTPAAPLRGLDNQRSQSEIAASLLRPYGSRQSASAASRPASGASGLGNGTKEIYDELQRLL
ncbi:MAG: hypothetical protein M1825_003656 [Sarcosagium campestre]|nr:MAG: hypothetical protein M1825_003656 [Sarcosagium campestre]